MCKLRPRGTGGRQWFCLPRMPWLAPGHPHSAFSKLRIWPLPPRRRHPRLDAPSSIPNPLLSDQLGSKGAGSPQLPPRPEENSHRWGPPGNPLCDLGQYQSFSGGHLTGQRDGWCQGGGHGNEEGGKMALESTGFWEAVGVPTTPSPAARPNSKARGCSWGKESGRLGFLRPSAVGEKTLRRGSGGGRLGAPQTCLCVRVSGGRPSWTAGPPCSTSPFPALGTRWELLRCSVRRAKAFSGFLRQA